MVRALRWQFRRRKTILAPNAAWMASRLQGLFGDVAQIVPNPFGVDAAWFAVERLPVSAQRGWLVVSRITRGKLGTLVEWGEGLFSAERPLYLLGPNQENIELPSWISHPGATNPTALRADWFPRVKGLLTLSQHDEGRPQVLIEAMAAGLPVIASRLPAHEDLIQQGETGWLVASRTELVNTLAAVETPQMAVRVGAAAQAFIKENVGTWDDCARRYLDCYGELQRGVREG
jgi:glycosyltransferase involved in cell wall biosynthesis